MKIILCNFKKKNKKHDSFKWKEEHDILHEILLMSVY